MGIHLQKVVIITCNNGQPHDRVPIHRKQKDGGGCTFYHNTLQNQTKPIRHMERYGLIAVIPRLTALLLSSLKDL